MTTTSYGPGADGALSEQTEMISTNAVLVRHFIQPADIWWTPKALASPLAETSDRVEVYIGDLALPEHVKAGRVQLRNDMVGTPVTESDIRLRFNNWDRIRAERLPSLVSAGIALGVSGAFFLFGVLGWGPRRRINLNE